MILPDEAEDRAVGVVRIDPLEALPAVVLLPHRRVLPVHMEEITHEILHAPVLRLLGEVPVEGDLLIPLVKLCEILSHKEKLLAGVTEHEEVAAL